MAGGVFRGEGRRRTGQLGSLSCGRRKRRREELPPLVPFARARARRAPRACTGPHRQQQQRVSVTHYSGFILSPSVARRKLSGLCCVFSSLPLSLSCARVCGVCGSVELLRSGCEDAEEDDGVCVRVFVCMRVWSVDGEAAPRPLLKRARANGARHRRRREPRESETRRVAGQRASE
jgi:hypothetical protein